MQAVIFIGIQATGKTTFYKEKFFNSHVRISLDLLKTRHREKVFLESCVQTKQPFVVDNTNTTIKTRKRYFELAKSAGFEMVGYYFQSKIQDAIERNKQRQKEHVIPKKGIFNMYNRLEIPSFEEGFDSLYYVYIDNNGEFQVEDWQDDIGKD